MATVVDICILLNVYNFLPNNRISRKCYEMSKSLDEVGRKTWCSKIRHLLCIYGCNDMWESQGVANDKVFLGLFKQRIKDCYMQEWHNAIEPSGKLHIYSNIKDTIEQATYLDATREKMYFHYSQM